MAKIPRSLILTVNWCTCGPNLRLQSPVLLGVQCLVSNSIKMWTTGVPVETAARRQIEQVARLPFIFRHVAVMPDVHVGMGSTVGCVIPTKGAIIPAAVGVDIGCGMMALRTSLTSQQLPESLAPLRHAIEEAIPHGRSHNGGRGDVGAWDWDHIPADVMAVWHNYLHGGQTLAAGLRQLHQKHRALEKSNDLNHLGTLGTGNHFIELCLDEADRCWLMLHSGSRGIGNRIGGYFIERAKELMLRRRETLPSPDLAWLPQGTPLFDDYVAAVGWAQAYALANREVMMQRLLGLLQQQLGPFHIDEQAVNCHHNYVAMEHHFGTDVWVTRKGALRAGKGEMGIIPGSMGSRSYIVRGRGHAAAFCSCSHGAGRLMSRGEARRRFSLADHRQATQGVECRQDREVLDETPAAYKDIDQVMAAQSDLVEIVHTLKQVVCVKG
ncbi:MAG: RtcB family protein [Magnetococcales bacterium]|nr:RtcB family protein [Magnetococcales bacterium]